jgi:hypothetical protein
MSAQSSSMHKITGSVRSAFGRMAGTSRSFVAAARLHPAGVAVPSAVIAVAVAFVTFLTAVVVRVIPPNLFGSGSPPIIQPSASQPRHRLHQEPVVAGPPMLRHSGGSQAHSPAGSPGEGSGSNGAGAPPTTLSTYPTPPISSGLTPTAGTNPASGSPASTSVTVSVTVGTGSPVTRASQTAADAVGTTATTVGQAVQGTTGAIETVAGTVAGATGTAVAGTVDTVTGTVDAVTGTVDAVTGTVGLAASTGESGGPASAQVSVVSPASAATRSAHPASLSGQTPATATVSVSDPAGNGSSQPAVSLSVSVP